MRIELCTTEFAKEQFVALKVNDGYCPCALVKNEDTKCLCKKFREQATEGACDCGLFVKRIITNPKEDEE